MLKEAREQEIELAAERYNVLMLQLFFEDGTETFYEKMKHLKIIWNSFCIRFECDLRKTKLWGISSGTERGKWCDA